MDPKEISKVMRLSLTELAIARPVFTKKREKQLNRDPCKVSSGS